MDATRSTGSKGRSQTHHHRFSAVIVHSDVPLKPLAVRPEGFFDRIAAVFGFDDIDFESAEFSRRFHVSGPDRKWAYDVLHPRAMEHLLRSPAYHPAFEPRCVIAWRGSAFDPAEFEGAAAVITGLLDGLPAYVVEQQRGG